MIFIDFIKATVAQTVNAPVQIRHLMQQLPAISKNCRANNTIKKYQQYFNAWMKWATDLNASFLPGNPLHIGLYILRKMQAGHSPPTIDATFFAIEFYHTSLLNTDPYQYSLVKNMFEAAKRLSNHKTKKKQALRPNELKQIYYHLSVNQSSLQKSATSEYLPYRLHRFYEVQRSCINKRL